MTIPLSSDNPQLASIEEARIGIQTMAVYHYQAIVDAGFKEEYAKQQTASLLESQHKQFLEQAGLPVKSTGTIASRIHKLVNQTKEIAKSNVEARVIYDELLSIEKSLKE